MSWKQNVAAVAATIISAVAAVLFSSAIAATVDPQSLTALGTSSTTIRHHVYEMHCNVQASTLGCLVISGPCFGFDEEGERPLEHNGWKTWSLGRESWSFRHEDDGWILVKRLAEN